MLHSSAVRRKHRGEAIARNVCRYIERHYLHFAGGVHPSEGKASGEEKIFSIWFQGEENAVRYGGKLKEGNNIFASIDK